MVTVQVSTFVFDNVNSFITSIDGLDSSSPLILNTLAVGRRAGQKPVSAVSDMRDLPITGMVIANSWSSATAIMDSIKAACNGTQIPVDINDGTSNRRFYCSLNKDIKASRVGVSTIKFSIPFVALDPPYGVNATQGGSEILTNSVSTTGINTDIYTAAPVFTGSAPPKAKTTLTVTNPGSITSLEVVDLVAARTLNVPGTNGSGGFNTGDTVIIDSDQKKVFVNQVSSNFTGQFPNFQPGTGSFELNTYTSTGYVLDSSQTNANNSYPLLATTSRICMGFKTVLSTNPITRISLILANVGNGANFTFSIQTDSSGSPSGTAVTGSTVTINASNLSQTANWYNISLPSLSVTENTQYWIVLTPTGNDMNNYPVVYTNYPQSYPNGQMKISVNSGSSFTTPGKDFALKVFTGAIGQNNQTDDSVTNDYSENFSTTTEKDASNTTANWNTAGPYLTMNGVNVLDQSQTTQTTGDNTGAPVNVGTAQSFTATGGILTKVSLYLKLNSGSTSDQTFYIYPDSGGYPATNSGFTGGPGTGSILSSIDLTVTSTSYGWVDWVLETPIALSAGSTYWIVSGNLAYPTITWGVNGSNAYLGGTGAEAQQYGNGDFSGWVYLPLLSEGYDFCFKTYMANYNTSEQGQTIELANTQSDIIATSQVTNTILISGSTYQGQVSADNGSTWNNIPRDSTPFATNNIPATISNQLKMRWLLQNPIFPYTVPPYVTSTNLYWKKGISLDATTKRGIQSFVPTLTGNVQRLDLFGTYIGTPGNITVRIETDNSGVPSGTLVNAAATLTQANPFTSLFGWATFNFASSFSLTSGTKYWIVAYAASTLDNTDKYLLQANNNQYTTGMAGKSTNSGTSYTIFSTSLEDLMFRFFAASGGNFAVNLSIDYVSRFY